MTQKQLENARECKRDEIRKLRDRYQAAVETDPYSLVLDHHSMVLFILQAEDELRELMEMRPEPEHSFADRLEQFNNLLNQQTWQPSLS